MTLKNTDPQLIQDVLTTVSTLLSNYGWHVLIAVIVVSIVWTQYLSKHYNRWKRIREESNIDREEIDSRLKQMEAIRRRQQELYDRNAEQMREREAEKQLLKKKELEELAQNVNNSKQKRSSGKSLFDNSFNPLMGSSSGSTYRPSRNCGPKGG